MSLTNSWKSVVVGLLGILMASCNSIQGISIPRDDGPSSAEFRFDAEFIPNAVLVREETTPHWPLGRYAFKRGADRLLVVSRITSFSEKRDSKDKEESEFGPRYDKVLERVWITIPLGTQIGEALDLETLERKFLVAYDEGELDGGIYVQPNRIYGTVRVLEEKSDSVTVDIDMVVQTKRMPSWSYHHTGPVSITHTGIRAKPARRYTEANTNFIKRGTQTSNIDQPHPTTESTLASEENDLQQSSETPADNTSSGLPPNSQSTSKMILGQWIGETHFVPGKPIFECRFQFDPDGKFYYSVAREAPPQRRYGTYEVKGKFVVLNIEYYYFANERPRTTEGLELGFRVQVLRFDPTPDGGMTIRVVGPEGAALRDTFTSVNVKPTRFPDMFKVPPPQRGEG